MDTRIIHGGFNSVSQECCNKVNPRRIEITEEEKKRAAKLEVIAAKSKRVEGVQNRRLKIGLAKTNTHRWKLSRKSS